MQRSARRKPRSDDLLLDLAEQRIAIEGIDPEIEAGRFAAKCALGEVFHVEADIFCDGHEVIAAELAYSADKDGVWHAIPFSFLTNDRWAAQLRFDSVGRHRYTIIAWRDLFATWQRDTAKKLAAGVAQAVDIEEGMALCRQAVEATDEDELHRLSERLRNEEGDQGRINLLLAPETLEVMKRFGPRRNVTRYGRELDVVVDPAIAAFGAWYELMPRSQSPQPGRHGTFDDVIARLPYVRDLGFDVLYFPPIHPIGLTNRKGPNNTLVAGPDDPGSPYAIGAAEGGHDAVHPELGTLADFDRLVGAAESAGLKIALDFAIQCSPDHPWIRQHPEWFEWRPDGTIKFAENPPKKYEDIVNVHFYDDALPELWYALRDIVLFWIDHGVTIFRVDNPHTKPFPFWEWMIGDVKSRCPEAIFLSEAFTRPKVMNRLAKLGFTQSYSYFTWRNGKQELQSYLEELTGQECRHYMRPNFFANTPDINPYYLQQNGRAGFRTRLVLAATLAGNYGIYSGFEICEAASFAGKEEYLDSEKYQLRTWDMDAPENIKDDIRLVNRLRRSHPAMRHFTGLRFYNAFDDGVLYYGKHDPASSEIVLFHVCLDTRSVHDFEFEVPLWEFDQSDDGAIGVEDMIHGNRFIWQGKTHRLRIDPQERPYAIWRLFPLSQGTDR